MSVFRSVHRDLRKALKILQKNGWAITVGGNGRLKLIAPGGKAMIGLPKTPRHGNVIWDLYNKLKIKGYDREGVKVVGAVVKVGI